jgi:hypothetical protein
MPAETVLPLPDLLNTVEIINLGPIIDPAFVDAPDWRAYLTPVDIRPVAYEQIDTTSTEERDRQAAAMALGAESILRELEGKRYEVMGVGVRSLDKQTEYSVVVIYNYTDDVVVEASVDPAGDRVTDVKLERYQPPVADSEVRAARELVGQHGHLFDAAVDVDTGEGIIVEEENFRSPRYGHRLVDLRFGPPDRRLPSAWAIVDLTDQQVISTGTIEQEESR